MKIVHRIIDWLKAHGEGTPDNKSLDVIDEPYERFAAEWQDWHDGAGKLFVGYYFEENGDLIPDPNMVVNLTSDKITSIMIETMVGLIPVESPQDIHYVEGFLGRVYDRHLAPRTTATVS